MKLGIIQKFKENSKEVFLLIGLLILANSFIFHIDETGELTKWAMASVALTMALWWIFEVAPLGITALLPLVCYPMLGIMSSKKIAPIYMSSTLFLFIGGFFVALAMQRWNLHKRIALNIISFFGNSPAKVILGFMSATWFLSMWISNTATTVMMVSIGLAIVSKIEESESEGSKLFSCALMLSIAYAASVGGMATLVGTPPNLAFSRIYSISFEGVSDVSFGQWLGYGLPCSMVIFCFVFIVLYIKYLKNMKLDSLSTEYVSKELKSLGKMSYEEKAIGIIFLMMAILWIFRKPLNLGLFVVPGWSGLFTKGKLIDDGTVAIFCALLLYIIPSKAEKKSALLNVDAIRSIPWETILLFGGGFALAKGMASSGLSDFLGSKFTALADFPIWLTMTALAGGMSFLTELTSNMASTEMILPILISMSKAINVEPLYLMVPTTLAASCAFMLPAATASNAIIFSSGKVRILQMIQTGIWINILSFIFIGVWSYFII